MPSTSDPHPAELPPGWFPVIDRERCTDCGQCLEFCLFGVYHRDDAGRVTVAVPSACKDGCPACARICPQGAITFPRHSDPVINGNQRRSGPGVEVAAGSGLMEQLRARRARTRLLRPEIEAALADRDACLAAAAQPVVEDGDGGCTCECGSGSECECECGSGNECMCECASPNVGAGAAPRTSPNVGAGSTPRTSPAPSDLS